MTTTAELIIDPSSISLRAVGPATGDIALAIGNTLFPASGWNDFIIVILEAWLGALTQLSRGTRKTQLVHFMEGPYEVELSRIESGSFRVRAIERPDKQRAVVDVDRSALIANASAIADATLRTCREANHHSTDVERLEAALALLKTE